MSKLTNHCIKKRREKCIGGRTTEMTNQQFLWTCFCRCFSVCARLATMGSHLEFWHKAGELLMPVVECRRWRDDQEWTPDVISLLQEQKSKYNVNHRNRWSAVLVWAAPRKQEVLEGLWSPQHAPSCQRQLTEKLAFPPFFFFFWPLGLWD